MSSSLICSFAEPDHLNRVRHLATTGFLKEAVLLPLLITLHFNESTSLATSTHSYHSPNPQEPNRHPAMKIESTLDLRPIRNSFVPGRPVRPAHILLEGRILEAADQILCLELVLLEVNLALLLGVKLGAEDNIARMRNLSHESNRHWECY